MTNLGDEGSGLVPRIPRGLDKFIFSMAILFLISGIAARPLTNHFLRNALDDRMSGIFSFKEYFPLLGFALSFALLLAVVVAYWPVAPAPYVAIASRQTIWSLVKGVGIGILVGSGCFLVTLPLIRYAPFLLLFDAQIATCATCASVLGSAVLLVVGLPVVVEIVFRRITLETMRLHAGFMASVAVSCGLASFLWPVFGWPTTCIFGVGSCLLFERSRSLTPSIAANVTLSSLAVLYHIGLTLHRVDGWLRF